MKNKISIIFLIIIIFTNVLTPVLNAVEINKADLTYDHAIDTHIKFYNGGAWHTIKCGYISYKINGEKYPAYCIKHGVHGVDEEGDYTVTINDLLKDKLIYNTILNGYPYKSPSQLGVETIDDAYVATKQAINTVLLERNVYEFYKAADEKGERIINAIYNISENGKKGNEINKDAKVNVQKVGKLIQEESFYYQEYKVTSDRNISEYEIEDITDFPSGSILTDVNGKETKKFNKGENFKVKIPKTQMNKNINGTICVSANCKTNPVFFGEAPRNNIQNYAVTYKPYANYKTSILLNENTNISSIKIIKKDEENKTPIKNVVFGLYKNNKLITTATTNENGIAIFDNLYQGEYRIKEEVANENYEINTEFININLKYNEQIVKKITNKHKKGSLKITKIDKDDKTLTLGGIEFELYDSNNKLIKTVITDSNGEALIENINIGEYVLKETKTKREYNLCIDKNIVVEWNKLTDLKIENEKKKGRIKIIKEDKEESEIKLEGVEFQIIDVNGKVVETLFTDKNGEAISSKLLIGNYKVKEVGLGTNSNYIINSNEYNILIENNETIQITIQNEHKKGNLKIIKVDKDDNSLTLGGIEFELIDEKGKVIDSLITDANGEAKIDNINVGKYTLKETKTKKEYNLCLDKELTVEWNKTSIIKIENEKKKGKIEIYKKDKNNPKIKIKDAEFNILNKENKIVETLKTNENGYAVSSLLPIGEYYLQEIKTDSKYILDNNQIKIEVKDNETVKLEVLNEKKKGKIKIIKISGDDSIFLNKYKGDKLSGVIFEIYNKNNELIEQVCTDENGEAISKELEVGLYRIREKSTIKGYILNKRDFFVNITQNDQIEKIVIKNNPIIPKVKIEKNGQGYAEKNEEIKYEFNIKNLSNTNLEKLIWKEYIPYKQSKITQIITGTYNEELNYNIYYKINNGEYKLLKECNSKVSEYINLQSIELQANEDITEIMVEYNNVSNNFENVIKTVIYTKVNDKVKNNEKIINNTEVIGQVDGFKATDKSKYETLIKEKIITKKLPKTGG